MANESPQPAGFEEEPLPEVKALNFDLSDQESSLDSIDAEGITPPENELQGEPEGIFSLFDREFPEGSRSPVEPSESEAFDKEFSENFDSMFEAVSKTDLPPLFNDQGQPLQSPENKEESSFASKPESKSNETEDLNNESLPDLASPVTPPALGSLEGSEEPRLEQNASSSESTAVSKLVTEGEESTVDNLELNEAEESLPELETVHSSKEESEKVEFELKDQYDNEEESSDNEEKPLLNLFEDTEEDELSDELSESWQLDESLEEINFDEPDDNELDSEDEDSEDENSDFDAFAKFALGLEEDDDESESIDEEDDFKVEEITEDSNLDPFEDVAIMSSEEVANYQSPFGEEELKFEEAKAASEDPDPFAVNETEAEESMEEIDPFGEEAMALAGKNTESTTKDLEEASKEEPEKNERKKKPKNKRAKPQALNKLFSFLWTIVLFPWKIYSQLTTILFSLLEGLISLLAKIPLLGIPFKLLSGILSSVPMSVKRIVVLAVIASSLWGGTTLIGNMLPKPSSQIELPDNGGAKISAVELEDYKMKATLTNTGDIDLNVAPIVEVFERNFSDPSSWFKPKGLGICEGDFVELQIDESKSITYDCSLEVSGLASLKPTLKD